MNSKYLAQCVATIIVTALVTGFVLLSPVIAAFTEKVPPEQELHFASGILMPRPNTRQLYALNTSGGMVTFACDPLRDKWNSCVEDMAGTQPFNKTASIGYFTVRDHGFKSRVLVELNSDGTHVVPYASGAANIQRRINTEKSNWWLSATLYLLVVTMGSFVMIRQFKKVEAARA